MTIEFTCKSCDTTLRVSGEHAGKHARCPKCQTLNLIQSDVTQFPTVGLSNDTSKSGAPYSNHLTGKNPPSMGLMGGGFVAAHRGSTILTLGIVSFICNAMAIPGIMAWIMGKADLREMDAGRMDPEGRGLTQAGMILGIISTGLVILSFLFMIGYLVVIALVISAGLMQ